MFKTINSKKQLLIMSVIATVSFYLLTHGQRFFSMSYSGDALLMIYQNDSAWQIALGRFVQPILVMLRGGIVSPFLISVLSVACLSFSVFLLTDYLEIRNVFSIFGTAAVMVCNITIVVANIAFLHNTDFYALALLLAVLGAWLIKKEKWYWIILGIICFALSMGTYQAYICVAITMIMIRFIWILSQEVTVKGTLKFILKNCVSLLVGAMLYYVIWKAFQNIFGIWTADTYNGLASVGDYSENPFFSVIKTTYLYVFSHFINPDVFVTMPYHGVSLSVFWLYLLRTCNVLVAIVTIVALVIENIKNKTKWWCRFLQFFVLVIFPIGINFVCIISQGMEHTLMIYAFCLVYIFGIRAVEDENLYKKERKNRMKQIIYIAMLIMVMLVSWSNIVYANQIYIKKELQEKATHSMMTRIVYEIESIEGYVAGETPVAFLGSFESTDYVPNMEAFKDIVPYGMGKSSITYIGTEYAYLTYVLNVSMNLTRVSNEDPEIQQMPVYPARGSIAMIDGVIVVKISE